MKRYGKHLLASIKRQLDAEAAAADAPSPPSIKITPGTEAVYNDPQLTARLVDALRRDLGPESVVEMPAKMTSEDFSEFGGAGVRACPLLLRKADVLSMITRGMADRSTRGTGPAGYIVSHPDLPKPITAS